MNRHQLICILAALLALVGCDREARTCDEIFDEFQPLWDCSRDVSCPMSKEDHGAKVRLHREWIACVDAKQQ
jgi:hypothetical protein